MKIKTLVTTTTLALATVAVLLWVAPVGAAGGKNPLILPPNSHAYGNSLTEWLTMYWQWYYGGADMAQSKVGDVQLMPLPQGTADPNPDPITGLPVTRGELEITIPAGTAIVLPEFAWVGERYEGYPTVPDDPAAPDDILLASAHPTLTIDGVTVMTDANKADYFVPLTYFDEPVMYPQPSSYGSVAALFFAGCGVVIKPLPPGQHTIHLYEPWVLDWWYASWAFVYDNTWHITVTP